MRNKDVLIIFYWPIYNVTFSNCGFVL